MKTVRIHRAARREFKDALAWYAERNHSLGLRFRDEVLAAITSAAMNPLRFPAYLSGTRRVLLKTFPYLVVFIDSEGRIHVVAIAHAKRKSGHWKGRISAGGS